MVGADLCDRDRFSDAQLEAPGRSTSRRSVDLDPRDPAAGDDEVVRSLSDGIGPINRLTG